MLSPTTSTPDVQRNAGDAARVRGAPGARRFTLRRLLPRARRLIRLIALSLAVCVMSDAVMTPPAMAQRLALPMAAYPLAQQVPTPTPDGQGDGVITVQGDIIGDPTSVPVVLVPVDVGTPISISGTPVPNSVQVQVQPTATPRLVVESGVGAPRGDCASQAFIFQGCPMAAFLDKQAAAAAERRIEDRAISLVLQQYGLPGSARPLVLRYGRPEIRAAIIADVQEAFRQIPDERSPDQQLLVDVYSKLVRETHTKAVTAAQAEYRRWNNNPCDYRPPSGFSYDARSACVGASQAFRPESPGIEAFVAYGFKNTYEDMVVQDPWAAPAFIATSSGMQTLYGAAATGYAAFIGAQVDIPTSMLRVIAPFATRAQLAVEGVSGGAAAGASFAGLFAVLVATISTIITGSMSLAKEVEIPNQLQGMVDIAPTYDIEWIMKNCTSGCVNAATADLRGQVEFELYTSIMLTTLPDYPGIEPAPTAGPGDARFVVDGRPTDWLRYKLPAKTSDPKIDWKPRAFRLGPGPWFVERAEGDGDDGARLTLQINYKDAAGAKWAVRRAGDQFIIVRTDLAPANIDYTPPRQSTDLSIADPSDRTVMARVAK